MSEQPEHVASLRSRVDDLADRYLTLKESQTALIDEVDELQTRIEALEDRFDELEAKAQPDDGNVAVSCTCGHQKHLYACQVGECDCVQYRPYWPHGPVVDRRLMTDPCECGHPENYHRPGCHGNGKMGIGSCRCEAFQPAGDRAPALDLAEEVYRHLQGYLTPYFVDPSIRRIATEIIALTRAEVTS